MVLGKKKKKTKNRSTNNPVEKQNLEGHSNMLPRVPSEEPRVMQMARGPPQSGRDFSKQGQKEKCPGILGLWKLLREEG